MNADILARKLAGMAHVVVEPSRGFSFQLMGKSLRKNPYAGAIGVFLPGHGEVSRHFGLGPAHQQRERSSELVEVIVNMVSKRVAVRGWEWQGLQEFQGRALRAKIINRASDDLDAYIDQFDREVHAKDERIRNLEQLPEIAQAGKLESRIVAAELLPSELIGKIGPQLYEGEFSDRLRRILEISLSDANSQIDDRTREMAKRLVENTVLCRLLAAGHRALSDVKPILQLPQGRPNCSLPCNRAFAISSKRRRAVPSTDNR